MDLLPGSDHVAFRVDLQLGCGNSVDPPINSLGFYINLKRDVTHAKVRMDELL